MRLQTPAKKNAARLHRVFRGDPKQEASKLARALTRSTSGKRVHPP
jgi:hypothetical protein